MTYTAIVTTSMTTDRATAQIVIYITNVEGHAAVLSPPSFQTPTRPRVSGRVRHGVGGDPVLSGTDLLHLF